MNLNDIAFKEKLSDKEIKLLMKSLSFLYEYQKKQIAILLMSDTLTKKSAKDILKLL